MKYLFVVFLVLRLSLIANGQTKADAISYIKKTIETFPVSSSYSSFVMMGDEPMEEDLPELFLFNAPTQTLPFIIIVSDTRIDNNQSTNYIFDLRGIQDMSTTQVDNLYQKLIITIKPEYTHLETLVNLSTKVRERVSINNTIELSIGNGCDMRMLKGAFAFLSNTLRGKY